MDWLFRRHFWIVHVVCLTLCAFVVAKTINTVVGAELQESFVVHPKLERPVFDEGKMERRDFDWASDRNIFQAQRESIVEIDVKNLSKGSRAGRWQDAVLSDLNVQLIGTAVFSDPKSSIATIIDPAARADNAISYSISSCLHPADAVPEAFAVGPMASLMRPIKLPCNRLPSGAIVVRIEVTRVYLFNENSSQYEYIEMIDGESPRKSTPPLMSKSTYSPVSGAAKLGTKIKQVGPNSFQIARDEFDGALSNLSVISTQARMVPVIDDATGKTQGFRIFQIQPGSVFTGLGLKDGDVIRSINDYQLDSPDKALELYSKLKNTSGFNIDIDRNGLPTSLDYSISP